MNRQEPHIWIVEIFEDGKWKPCAEASLDKVTAVTRMVQWKQDYQSNRFRVRKYVRVSDSAPEERT